MQTRQQGTGWIITTDPKWTDDAKSGGISNRSMANMTEVYQCWMGDRWGNSFAAPQCFSTEKDAMAYLTKNGAAMEHAP